jgi:protein-S-isoprenylcysteine O-methyltransferase Ste14
MSSSDLFKWIFLIGLIVAEVIRFPHRMRNKQERRKKQSADRTRPIDLVLDLAAFSGMEIIPLIYVFSGWPPFADYARLDLLGWLGAIAFAGCLYLLYRAHIDLGRNWSPTVEVTATQSLVTSGIYGVIRHPIYAAMWLWGVAQALLLANWIAGPATLVLFGLVYFVRVPREEQMMLDHFGEEYRAYLQRTGGVIPKF